MQYGIDYLTTQELLIVLLGSGIRGVNVRTLARILEKVLHDQPFPQLHDIVKIHGIGLAKACQLLAALELAERLRPRHPDAVIDSLEKVLHIIADLSHAQRERVVGLYLDARLQLIEMEVLAVGSVNQSIIAPRDVFSVIQHRPVVYLILAHNHPSGNVEPSPEDIAFTRTMRDAGVLLGVELLDHVIVGKQSHYSFKEHGRMDG